MGVAGCNRHTRSSAEDLYKQIRSSLDSGELLEAMAAADKGIRIFQKQPEWAWRFQVQKADVLVRQGKMKEALSILDAELPQSLAASDDAIRRFTLMGIANYRLQRFDDAKIDLDQAERLAATHHPELLGDVAIAQAALAYSKSDLNTAESLNRNALKIARAQHQRFLEASALSNLGVFELRQQHCADAVEHFDAALAIARDLHNRTLFQRIAGNAGWCYYKLGDFDRALESFTQAEKTAAGLGVAQDQVVWLTNIGSIHYEHHNSVEATNYYQRALTIARNTENKSQIAVCLNNLSATALETKHFDEAEKYNNEALALKRAIGDTSSEQYSLLNQARIAAGRLQFADATRLLKDIIARSGEDASLRWEAESELAITYAAQNNNAAAEKQFRTALTTIDKARAALSKEEHRLSFLGSAERFYNDYIDFLISRGHTREALGVAEHSRARTLAEGLKIPVAGVLNANFSPEQTARKLNSVILAYWLKPGQSYLWTVTPSRVVLSNLPPADQIDFEIQSYRKALLGPRDVKETTNAAGTKLYDMLVAPAQNLIAPGSRVIVIADRALNLLNFETVLAPKPQVHYWIEDAVISNASSIALLARTTQRKLTTNKKLLLIGDPIYTGTDFPELKQAKLELQDVANHFPANQREVLERAAATPAAYAASNAGNYTFVHFVAHGTASRTSPLDSSIILSRQSDAYKLYARDIMKQPLRAELVTISACYGAGNRAYSGEGLVGLSWAFLRAGAHNVVAALWEVSDTSTPELMDAMYAGLQSGNDPATALRAAKLKMLRSGSIYRRPFYWGAFQLYSGS
jgi:CHAT domain-containing protein/tetratricopeptide (TPR) repeat protein